MSAKSRTPSTVTEKKRSRISSGVSTSPDLVFDRPPTKQVSNIIQTVKIQTDKIATGSIIASKGSDLINVGDEIVKIAVSLALSPTFPFIRERDIRPWANNEDMSPLVKQEYDFAFSKIKNSSADKLMSDYKDACDMRKHFDPSKKTAYVRRMFDRVKVYNTDEYVLNNQLFNKYFPD